MTLIPKLCATIGFLLVLGCSAPYGPAITVCVTDVKDKGFQCVTYPNTRFFLPFASGSSLKCLSPSDAESALKDCNLKNPMTLEWAVPSPDVDNYVCISDNDRSRLMDRCK
jgi:hypothetical protein